VTGYKVDIKALEQTQKGIQDTLSELEHAGLGGAAEGRGFSGLKLSGLQLGPDGVTSALSDFCDRWSWGVRALVQDGNEIARRLGLSAGVYYQQEQYVQGVLKDAITAAMGNPHQSQAQTEQESWGQVVSDNPFTQVENADYSVTSFQQAAQHSEQVWSAEGTDLKQLGERVALGPAGDVVVEGEHITGKDVL
jgi:hypothetical protein